MKISEPSSNFKPFQVPKKSIVATIGGVLIFSAGIFAILSANAILPRSLNVLQQVPDFGKTVGAVGIIVGLFIACSGCIHGHTHSSQTSRRKRKGIFYDYSSTPKSKQRDLYQTIKQHDSHSSHLRKGKGETQTEEACFEEIFQKEMEAKDHEASKRLGKRFKKKTKPYR